MYNRYVPQNDGTYARKSIPEQRREPPAPTRKDPPPAKPPAPPLPLPCQNCSQLPPPKPKPCRLDPGPKAGSFLKHLLPKDFATEDLLIVLLLLLMAEDCPEEQNSALLTLALYLFL